MNTIILPVATDCPLKMHAEGDELIIPPTVDYFLNLLVSNTPAELTAGYSEDSKTAIWSIHTTPQKRVVHTESIHSCLFRPCLARIALNYMGGNIYGGFNRVSLNFAGKIYSAVFYLGNDSLCGFWVKVRCGNQIENSEPIASPNSASGAGEL